MKKITLADKEPDKFPDSLFHGVGSGFYRMDSLL